MAFPDSDLAFPDSDFWFPSRDLAVPSRETALPDSDLALPDSEFWFPSRDLAVPSREMGFPRPGFLSFENSARRRCPTARGAHPGFCQIHKEARKKGGQHLFSSWIPAAPGFLRLVLPTNRIGRLQTRNRFGQPALKMLFRAAFRRPRLAGRGAQPVSPAPGSAPRCAGESPQPARRDSSGQAAAARIPSARRSCRRGRICSA